jgi:hypothetical protein
MEQLCQSLKKRTSGRDSQTDRGREGGEEGFSSQRDFERTTALRGSQREGHQCIVQRILGAKQTHQDKMALSPSFPKERGRGIGREEDGGSWSLSSELRRGVTDSHNWLRRPSLPFTPNQRLSLAPCSLLWEIRGRDG